MEFNRTIADWFKLFRTVGFTVDDYLEPRPPPSTATRAHVSVKWARRFPSEQIWKLRRNE